MKCGARGKRSAQRLWELPGQANRLKELETLPQEGNFCPGPCGMSTSSAGGRDVELVQHGHVRDKSSKILRMQLTPPTLNTGEIQTSA